MQLIAFIVSVLLAYNAVRGFCLRRAHVVKTFAAPLKYSIQSIAAAGIVYQLSGGWDSSIPLAVTETRQGLYKEYTVEKVDDSALDEMKRTYKTAEETDTSKNKYWTILAVLLAGSFAIPMVQYFWYVADED